MQFGKFHGLANEIRQFQNPFQVDIIIVEENLQMGVIKLQASDTLKDLFEINIPTPFYASRPKCLPELRSFVAGMLTVFGSTYLCKKTFFHT